LFENTDSHRKGYAVFHQRKRWKEKLESRNPHTPILG
jgi:hypothetical protein